jgi:hypothetical protein
MRALSDRVKIDSLIRMTKLVSNAPDIPPRLIRTTALGFGRKPDSGFADYLQFAFDGGNSHRIQSERLEIHPRCELLKHRNCVHDVSEPALRW